MLKNTCPIRKKNQWLITADKQRLTSAFIYRVAHFTGKYYGWLSCASDKANRRLCSRCKEHWRLRLRTLIHHHSQNLFDFLSPNCETWRRCQKKTVHKNTNLTGPDDDSAYKDRQQSRNFLKSSTFFVIDIFSLDFVINAACSSRRPHNTVVHRGSVCGL